MKKVIGISGCRSEYDILYSLFKKFRDDPDYDFSIIVTGTHLVDMFGYTIKEIEEDGFRIIGKVHNLINSDRTIGKAKSSGLLLTGLSELLYEQNPDLVVVAADREESLVTGIACTYLEIPFIHLAAGDRTYPGEMSGDVDEQIRHATTKLASIHVAFAKEHAERVIKMGEEPWRVCYSGNTALDRFNEIPSENRNEILKYFGFETNNKPLILVIQHVISSEHKSGSDKILTTLSALQEIDVNIIVNYPNSDMGSQGIINIIESYREKPRFRITKNIPRYYFANLLRNIDVLIGNSSLAFLEGSYLSLPAINIGNRQKERLHGGNVVFVDYDKKEISETVKKVIFNQEFNNKLKDCKQIYGNGKASSIIIEYLKNLNKSREQLVSKNITY